MKKYSYYAFGLNIHSEFEIPPLLPSAHSTLADVTIKQDEVSKKGLATPNKSTPFYQSAKNQLWLHVPEIAHFLVTHGNQITVNPAAKADTQSIRLFLLGSCMGAILHQRGLMVLHGNAIRFGGHCVVFAGTSGGGKSTLAAAFHQQGHEILADDVCAINEGGCVVPGYPQLKLWSDTLARLKIEKTALSKVRLQVEKYAYPIHADKFAREPLPVRAIYILGSNNRDEFTFEPVDGMNKFLPLKNQTYRQGYIEGMELQARHLQLCGSIAGKVSLIKLSRPNHGFKIKQLLQHIEADLQERGIVH